MRSSDRELESVHLHLNRMNLIMPEDGSLPPRDEVQWSLVSEPWLSLTEQEAASKGFWGHR